jgi:hypothetical protein
VRSLARFRIFKAESPNERKADLSRSSPERLSWVWVLGKKSVPTEAKAKGTKHRPNVIVDWASLDWASTVPDASRGFPRFCPVPRHSTKNRKNGSLAFARSSIEATAFFVSNGCTSTGSTDGEPFAFDEGRRERCQETELP